jgi:hypothetical protein
MDFGYSLNRKLLMNGGRNCRSFLLIEILFHSTLLLIFLWRKKLEGIERKSEISLLMKQVFLLNAFHIRNLELYSAKAFLDALCSMFHKKWKIWLKNALSFLQICRFPIIKGICYSKECKRIMKIMTKVNLFCRPFII